MKTGHYSTKNREGQAMLLAVLALGGAILGATSIAGLLMVYQIRATTDAQSSAKAIFAADSGVEWSLYSFFKPPETSFPTFGNGATLEVTCSDASSTQLTTCDGSAGTPATAVSRGTSLSSTRVFLLNFDGATSTIP